MTLVPGTLEVLERTPAALRVICSGMPRERLETPGSEGWSPRDVVAHLASAFADRIRLILEHDDPTIENIDEEDLLERSGLRALPVGELIERHAAARAETLAWVGDLTPAQFARAGRHSVAGRISAADIVHHFAYHDLLHIRQICALLGGPIDEARGAMRSSFPDPRT